jgi:hypothetical protein
MCYTPCASNNVQLSITKLLALISHICFLSKLLVVVAVIAHVTGAEYDKTRRRSTIHSYTLSNYHALSHDPRTMRAVHEMTKAKAY